MNSDIKALSFDLYSLLSSITCEFNWPYSQAPTMDLASYSNKTSDRHQTAAKSSSGRTPRKYGFACANCRKKKARCNGEAPSCRRCTANNERCRFDKYVYRRLKRLRDDFLTLPIKEALRCVCIGAGSKDRTSRLINRTPSTIRRCESLAHPESIF